MKAAILKDHGVLVIVVWLQIIGGALIEII